MMAKGINGGGDGLDAVQLESLALEQDNDSEIQEAECAAPPLAAPLSDSAVQRAQALRKEIATAESVLGAQQMAKVLQDLYVQSGNAEADLSLVHPWEADDDTVRVLLSNLVLEGDGMHGKGPALVLCSLFLPKLLTRFDKDCMHPLHVTAFCHRLLTGEKRAESSLHASASGEYWW